MINREDDDCSEGFLSRDEGIVTTTWIGAILNHPKSG
jgi:hypothetical protein